MPRGSFGAQVRVLLWKLLLVRSGSKMVTLLEVVVPSLVCCLLVIPYVLLGSPEHEAKLHGEGTVLNLTEMGLATFCLKKNGLKPSNSWPKETVSETSMVPLCPTIGDWDGCFSNTSENGKLANVCWVSQKTQGPGQMSQDLRGFSGLVVPPHVDIAVAWTHWAKEKDGLGGFNNGGQPAQYKPGRLLLIFKEKNSPLSAAFRRFVKTYAPILNMVLVEDDFLSFDDAKAYAQSSAQKMKNSDGSKNDDDDAWAYVDFRSFNALDPTPTYTIRMNQQCTPPTFSRNIVDTSFQGLGENPGYLEYIFSGFVSLEIFLNEFTASQMRDYAIRVLPDLMEVNETLRQEGNNGYDVALLNNTLGQYLQSVISAPFPTPRYTASPFVTGYAGKVIPLVTTIALLFPMARTVVGLVDEKETGLRSAFFAMGMKASAHYVSTLLAGAIVMLFISGGITLVGALTFLRQVDPSLAFVINYCFGLTVIAAAFVTSAYHNSVRRASIAAPLMFFVSTIPHYAIPDTTPSYAQGFASILPCTAYSRALSQAIAIVGGGRYCDWTFIFSGEFSIATCLLIMVLDVFLYLALAMFVDLYWAKKTPFSGLKRWVVRRYKAPFNTTVDDAPLIQSIRESSAASHHHHQPLVVMYNLTKSYNDSDPPAVNGVNLDIRQEELLVLLGHNGAGKSTLLQVVLGMLPPTSGSVKFASLDDLSDNTGADASKSIGYCPQENILWHHLTVHQHLVIAAIIKGVSFGEADASAEHAAELANLSGKAAQLARNLSGGQKRKLCLAMAIVGDSRVLVLDEPTSGMDALSRREVWATLGQLKKSRAVLISTHFMEEADMGDRVVIMSRGFIQCCGSRQFLKEHFNVGYTLVARLVSRDDTTSQASLKAKAENLAKQLAAPTLFPDITIHSIQGHDVSYTINSKHVTAQAINSLETQLVTLGIESFGVANKTMEDVFLKSLNATVSTTTATTSGDGNKAAEREGEQPPRASAEHTKQQAYGTTTLDVGSTAVTKRGDTQTIPQRSTWRQQLRVLIKKKADNAKRDRRTLCYQVLFPVFMITVALLVLLIKLPVQPRLDLTPSMFGSSPTEVVFAEERKPHGSEEKELAQRNNQTSPNQVPPPDTQVTLLLHLAPQDHDYFEFTPTSCAVYDNASTCVEGVEKTLLAEVHSHSKPRFIALAPNATVSTTEWRQSPDHNHLVVAEQHGALALLHNASALHALPMAISTLHSTYIKSAIIPAIMDLVSLHNTTTPSAAAGANKLRAAFSKFQQIAPVNHPQPLSGSDEKLRTSFRQLIGAFVLLIPFLFIPSNYIHFIVRERTTKAKHLQLLSGARLSTFWSATFLWDLMLFMGTSLLTLCVLACVGSDMFTGDAETFFATLVLLITYGAAAILQSYVMSFFFATPVYAALVTLIFNFMVGFVLTLLCMLLLLGKATEANTMMRNVLRIFPPFALGDGIMMLAQRQLIQQFQVGASLGSPFGWALNSYDFKDGAMPSSSGVGTSLLYMAIVGPLLALAVVSAETLTRRRARKSAVNNQSLSMNINGAIEDTKPHLFESTNVTDPLMFIKKLCRTFLIDESEKDDSAGDQEQQLTAREQRRKKILRALCCKKPPPKVPLHAVVDLSLDVRRGEVVCLLGPNGAGKSTTLSIVSGQEFPSSGTFGIHHTTTAELLDVEDQFDQLIGQIGLCPQSDALEGNMTPTEHLHLHGGLRGYSADYINQEAEYLFHQLGIEEYSNVAVRKLSGGTKRKVSLAVAVLGKPPLVLIDEASSGMDPAARRSMWDAIKTLTSESAVVLTTHHLEEAEALADRVGIMTNGSLRCLGSLQFLKERLGGGGYHVSLHFGGSGNKDLSEEDHGSDALLATDQQESTMDIESLLSSASNKLRSAVKVFNAEKREELNGYQLVAERVKTVSDESHTVSYLMRFVQQAPRDGAAGRNEEAPAPAPAPAVLASHHQLPTVLTLLERTFPPSPAAAPDSGERGAAPVAKSLHYTVDQATLDSVFTQICSE